MSKTITSTPITFIDQTDSRKLEVYITSNMPTVQIFNGNSGVYTPNWTEGEKLVLSMDVFLDSRAMTTAEYNGTAIKWYKNDVEMSDNSIEDISDDKRKITIKDNILKDNPIITYTCEAEYQGIKASTRVTFTRVDTGLNGAKGADGTSVRILGTAKSATPVSNTNYHTIVYDAGSIVAAELGDAYVLKSVGHELDGHLFVCALLNGGQGGTDYFIDAGQIQGPAGDPAKSITLIGSAQVFKVGKDGKTITPKSITVTAHTVNIDNNSGIKWQYKYDADATWTEITNKIVQDASGKTVISINSNNDIATVNVEYLNSRTSIALKTTYDNAEDAFTLYKVFDGIDGEKGNPGDDAPIVFLSNEHISFVADANGLTYGGKKSILTNIVAYRGTTKVEPQINLVLANASLPDGMSISIDEDAMASIKNITPDFSEIILNVSVDSGVNLGSDLSNNGMIPIQITSPANVVLQLNWTKVNAGPEGEAGVGINNISVEYGKSENLDIKPENISWDDTIPAVDDGWYLWTKTIIDYADSDKQDTVTYTYAKQGSKGDTGTSISEVDIEYIASNNPTTPPSSGWSSAVVATTAEKPYLWTKTTFKLEDGATKDAYSVAKQGSSGRGIDKITEYYFATSLSSGVTASTSGWTTTIQTVTSTNRYLWNYEIISYTDGTTNPTDPIIIGVYGNTGNTGPTGNGISSIEEWYLATTASSGVTTSASGWKNTMQALTATNKYLWNYELITYTNGNKVSTTPVIVGVYGDKGDKGDTGGTGRGISSIAEQYYQSTSATSQADGTWSTTAPTWVDGRYIWTRSVITYTDATTYTTTPICVTGQKGGTGGTGVGVSSVDVWYYHSTSATALSGGSWSTTAPTWSDGKYVWTKTITTYTNNTTDETAAVCITGQKGSTGVGIKSVTEYYLATASSSGVTVSTTGWTTAIQTITVEKKYLWNYEVITYTDNTTSTTNPIIIGVFGNTGGTGPTGKGIKSITEYYLATTAATGVTTSTTGWTTAMQTLTATNKYLWNYELITYTDDTTATINPVIIGAYGDRGLPGNPGDDAYTVLLTNESHVFRGGVSAAVASSATTQVLAYKKTDLQSVTIVSVNGVAAKTTTTATGIAGLSFSCSALTGQPTITFTCTTAFVSPNGTIPIVVSVGGISFTKLFTYSIAFQGSAGAPSSSYWLVSNASAVQKTSSGDILCNPETLTFTGRIQTGTSAPANYACRWIIATSTDGSTYTDAYTSAANEATKSFAASATYKAVRVRMYLAGGTTTLLDEQIIPFVSDGETGAIGSPGDPGVTFQVYSNNGYALSTSVSTILLQTFAYLGDVEITAGATFQWYRHNGTDWAAVSGATNAYFNVSRDDVSFSNNYMCKMQFAGTEYVGVVTIDDKNDENKVFASKPSNYFAGDLWIVGTDYAPPGYTVGTMLRAEHTNATYIDSDWVPATKYDDEIKDLRTTIDSYKQYFSVNSTNGLQIGNSSINNDVLTIDHVETSTMDAISANIESLDVVGRYSGGTMLQAPIINLGKFSLVIESNGSLSIVANT